MKRIYFGVAFIVAAVVCISWGAMGHRTVADIAERHLTARARAAVVELLGADTLAGASVWADEVRREPAYRNTAGEHFLNLPAGLSHDQFTITVTAMQEINVYVALLQNERILRDIRTTKAQKVDALRFVVHFVGDIHQPMHVSQAEDKGGNLIQVRYNNRGTNLHALWDSKLLERAGQGDDQLAKAYDHPTAAEIQQWQKDLTINWAWESYQISGELYAAAEKPGGSVIDETYYEKYMPVVERRLEQAGVRLAGVLNDIFKDGLPASAPPGASAWPGTVSGDTYCAVVYGGKYFSKSGMTLLNLGAAYPNAEVTVVIKKKDLGKWNGDPIELYDGRKICVKGKQTVYKGKAEIVVDGPGDIEIQ